MGLKPTRSVLKVEPYAICSLSPDDITSETVGEKAFGLSCLPSAWTLPFVVVSSELLSSYRSASSQSEKETNVSRFAANILNAYKKNGAPCEGAMIVRSSAVSEYLEERGRYYSVSGTFETIEQTLLSCLSALSDDDDLALEKVHLIVQQAVVPVSAKGHLSNERRCYEEARDWLGEFETGASRASSSFSVNLRNWRSQESEHLEHEPLTCHLVALISKTLSAPAWWAKKQNVRVHFEWVWDGRRIYIVQADEAKKLTGVNPTAISRTLVTPVVDYQPKCLAEINQEHAAKYHKIKNVYTYLTLKLPITKIYVLDDQEVLTAIRNDSPPPDLISDLESLVPASLVIRTDLATDDLTLRQLLPRTNEVRDIHSAMKFLKETLDKLSSNNVTDQVAFIFHNFIPAVSAAFAYSAPGQRKVLIEALWGLPEGLYYNAHDKFEVDTMVSTIGNSNPDIQKFRVTSKPRFKRNFVAPDESGNWITMNVAEPWDWRPSIRKDLWVRQIALDSKRIAEQEGRAVSIMWFVDLPQRTSQAPVLPWYHEPFDFSLVSKSRPSKSKTPFDRSLVIRTKADIASLEHETTIEHSFVRQVRIQPKEDDLLRNKELLKNIGELTKKIGAVILLEGGTLSHAYYQLIQSQAVVEVVDPFDASEEKREFNKLVRDNIPGKIQQGGESVHVTRLVGDQLLRVLREKLVEEAYEALGATDHEAIIEELADVEEVIDGILKQLRVKRNQLRDRQKSKSNKAGGFEKGYVLLATNNPSPTRTADPSNSLSFEFDAEKTLDTTRPEQTPPPLPSIIAKWSDRREHGPANERIMSLVVSLVSDNWSAESPDIALGDERRDVLHARVNGQRDGANLRLDFSIFTTQQLPLFNDQT